MPALAKEIQNFHDLDAWKQGHELVLQIYQITEDFPKTELFGIISQLRRAASSITANIAEGFGRFHFNDKARFYYQARGSAGEVLNFLILSKDLSFLNPAQFKILETRVVQTQKLINGLIRSIEAQKS